jgi:Xaa-Pro aminopeptidase
MTHTSHPVIANVARLNDFMDRHRLAAVVVRSGQNFTYLAGFAYPGTLARHLDLPDSVRGIPCHFPTDARQGSWK